jgi:hypothetical protein
MKKRYFCFVLAGLVLGYIAKVEHWFEDEREIYFPITAEQIRAGVKEAKLDSNRQPSSAFDVFKQKITSKNSKNYNRSVNQKLALLKSANMQEDLSDYLELKKLYLEIVRNKEEDMLVRRQAYKNWVALDNINSNKTTEEHRLGQLANFSDEKMLNSLIEDAY